MAGLVGAALVNLNKGNAASPWHDRHKDGVTHDSMLAHEGSDWKALVASQKQQLEEYKQATHQFILERYYALEQSIEHMLKVSHRLSQETLESSLQIEGTRSQDSSADTTLLRDVPEQLGKIMRVLERQSSDEQHQVSEQFMLGIKKMEETFEREIGKQCEAISALSHNFKGSTENGTSGLSGSAAHSYPGSTSLDGSLVLLDRSNLSAKRTDSAQSALAMIEGANCIDGSMQMQGVNESQIPQILKQDALTRKYSAKQGAQDARTELGQTVGFVNRKKRIRHHELFNDPAAKPRNKCHAMLQKVVHSPSFVMLMELCIAANVVIKAVQMDVDVRRAVRNEEPVGWGFHVDIVFTIVFVLEVALRLASDGPHFFVGKHWGWNVFDFSVVLISCFEVLTHGSSLSFLRIFRSVRLVRVLKMVRIFRLFRELRLMAVSIASCVLSLFWAFVLILIVVLCFAMFILEGSKTYLLEGSDVDEDARRQIATLYGSFPEAAYSLVQAISGGDWGTFAAPLLKVSWVYGAGFAFFVSFVTLGMMNILLGIMVDHAHNNSQIDRELVIQEEIEHRQSYMNQLRELFHELDEDHSGTITYPEFESCLSDERAQAYLHFLQLSVGEAQGLFQLLDLDENKEIGVEEFVLGCMRLKGAAKSIDAASMMFQTKRLAMKVNELYGYVRERLDLLVNLTSAQRGQEFSL